MAIRFQEHAGKQIAKPTASSRQHTHPHVEKVSVIIGHRLRYSRACSGAASVRPSMVLLSSVTVPLLKTPPPITEAVLLRTTLLLSVAVPLVKIPPPPLAAVFPLTVLLVSVSVPLLLMPPPMTVVFPLTVLGSF